MIVELLNELFDSSTLKTASFVDKLNGFLDNSQEDNPTITREQFIALVSVVLLLHQLSTSECRGRCETS